MDSSDMGADLVSLSSLIYEAVAPPYHTCTYFEEETDKDCLCIPQHPKCRMYPQYKSSEESIRTLITKNNSN